MRISFKGYIGLIESFQHGMGIHIFDDGRARGPFADEFPTGVRASVRFAIRSVNEWPKTLDEVAADEIAQLEGKPEPKYYSRYSDITGYLWTEEHCKVGGHDLLKVLYENIGRYIWMEIEYEYK